MLDMLFIQETKLDDSFPKSQFEVPGFKMYRCDQSSNKGGIMMLMRNDIAHKRREELENVNDSCSGRIEVMVMEVVLKGEKWLYASVYKQPKVNDRDFVAFLEEHINICRRECSNIVVTGDINLDIWKKGSCVQDVLHVNGIKNIVKEATCFKGVSSSSIDVVLSNVFIIGFRGFHVLTQS